MKKAVVAFSLVLVGLLTACASWFALPYRPEVSIAGLKPVQIGVFEQRFTLHLRIQNPNDAELVINGLAFEVELNGQPFLRGLSDKPVTVPRYGEAVSEVTATGTLASALQQLREMQKSGRERVDYRISGRLQLTGHGSVPFERRGELRLPPLDSTPRKPLPSAARQTADSPISRILRSTEVASQV